MTEVVAVAAVAVAFGGFVVFMAFSRRISAHLAHLYREDQERRRREREAEEFRQACIALGRAFDNLAHAFVVSFTPAILGLAASMQGMADALEEGRHPLFEERTPQGAS